MKVICIDDNGYPDGLIPEFTDNKVKFGGIYNVIDTVTHSNDVWYELKEDIGFWYWANCFAPLSNIDETEMKRQYSDKPSIINL